MNGPDFGIDIWPYSDENQAIYNKKLDVWPKLARNSVLFLGDESLQMNWGLVLRSTFIEENQTPWFLSTCMTAQAFKEGRVSSCGFWSSPYSNDLQSGLFMTVDQTEGGERLVPQLIMDENVKKVVISFGHRVSVMKDTIDIRKELSAIELLAKWSHSAGKKCYVIEPTDAYFLETGKADFLTDPQSNALRVSITNYCDWIDAHKLRAEFLQLTQLPVDQIISNHQNDDSKDFITLPKPELIKPYSNEDKNLAPIEIPKNIIDPSRQDLSGTKSMQELIDENRADQDNGSNDPLTEDSQFPDSDFAPRRTLRPTARPQRISKSAQEEIRTVIEGRGTVTGAISSQEQVEPRYLWVGHQVGSELTQIGKKYLNNDVGSFLKSTRELRDVQNFCPNYWNLSQKHREFFWLYLYSAMARFENDRFDPSATHQERKSGNHSTGIFQVDTENCGYGSDSNHHKLFDVDNNFKCAIKHGAKLVRRGSQIADGRYRGRTYSDYGMDGYWSVLRKPYVGAAKNSSTGRYQNVELGRRGKIIELTRSTKICKQES